MQRAAKISEDHCDDSPSYIVEKVHVDQALTQILSDSIELQKLLGARPASVSNGVAKHDRETVETH